MEGMREKGGGGREGWREGGRGGGGRVEEKTVSNLYCAIAQHVDKDLTSGPPCMYPHMQTHEKKVGSNEGWNLKK